ncbi:MAG: hypothetical protein WC655_25020, partial [Candidatus Hydrogenedentales bacterium]
MAVTINRRELRQMTKNMQPIEVQTHLVECLQGGDLKPDDFSIRTLFEETVPNGNEIVESF